MLKNSGILLSLVTACIMLSACQSSDPYADIKAEMDSVRAKPRGRIEPPPEFEPYQTFTYSAALLRSPFRPPVDVEETVTVKVSGKQVKPNQNRSKEVLEEFGLDTLIMVGIITRPNEDLFALIKDNKAGIHRVKTGNYMGRNHGHIRSITPTKIELIEIIPDGQDGWVERPRTLVLQDKG